MLARVIEYGRMWVLYVGMARDAYHAREMHSALIAEIHNAKASKG
jgi:hypothetical protein